MANPAPKKTNPKLRINMLHPQGESLAITARFLKWLTSYGRYIIIVVEIVVLICFFLRFQLEQENKSLTDKITTQSQILQAQANNEKLIKQVQLKLQQIKQNTDNNPEWTQVITSIAQKTPQTVKLTSLNLDHSQANKTVSFKIVALTSSNSDIGLFIQTLKGSAQNESGFTNINLDGINYDQGQLNFTISGSTK